MSLTNLSIFISGVAVTVLVLGLSSGILSNWIKVNLNSRLNSSPAPSASVEPIKTATPSLSPTPTPEPSYIPTTKGGQVLGKTTSTFKPVVSNNYSYATVVYEFKDKDSNNWQVRGNYDTRYENYIDFDEVSKGYDRKVTVCLYSSHGQVKCEPGQVEPAVYTYNYLVGGKKLVYEIVSDKNGPIIKLEGPWKNTNNQTCVKVSDISDNLTPFARLVKLERMDNADWRQLHSEYCLSGNQGDKHTYQVRVKDEAGNETTSTYTFTIL